MSTQLKEALGKLNPELDDHWTADGLPRLDVLNDMGVTIARAELTAQFKSFTRSTPEIDPADPADPAFTSSKENKTPNESSSEPSQTSNTDDEGLDDEEAAKAELEAANKNLQKAQKRQRKATLALDVFVEERSTGVDKSEGAKTIQAFQKSQRKQREENVAKKKAMVLALEANKENF